MRQPFFSNIVNEEKVVIAPEQGKTPVTISSDDVCAEHAFLYFLPKGKFGCNAPRDITISSDGYFDQNQIKIIYIYYRFTRKCHSQTTPSSEWKQPGPGNLFSTAC